VGVVHGIEPSLVREALVLERFEEQLERFLVERLDIAHPHARLRRDPSVATPDAELVTTVEQDLGLGDAGGQHRRVVVREHVQHRAEPDLLRPGRQLAEERQGVRGGREPGEEQVLDDRVGRVAEAIRVNHLLSHLGVEPLARLAAPVLHLRIDAEPHVVCAPRVGPGAHDGPGTHIYPAIRSNVK
jgi:hypothetical protein